MNPNTIHLILSIMLCAVSFIPVFLTLRRHNRTPGMGFGMQFVEMVISIFVSMILGLAILILVKTIISLFNS